VTAGGRDIGAAIGSSFCHCWLSRDGYIRWPNERQMQAFPFKNPSDTEHLIAGLRLAGLK
jgi:hypothetical protein